MLPIHWYHQRDLTRVLDAVALRNVAKANET
jgi:hypothetical protein